MHQEKCLAAQRGKIIERFHLFTAADGQRRFVLQKEIDVRAEGGSQLAQGGGGERRTEQFVQAQQSGRGVAAAAAKSGRERDFFIEMDFNAIGNVRCRQESGRGAMHEISGIGRQTFFTAGQFDRISATLKEEFVAEIDRLHDGFKLVKTIGAPPRILSNRLTLQGDFRRMDL